MEVHGKQQFSNVCAIYFSRLVSQMATFGFEKLSIPLSLNQMNMLDLTTMLQKTRMIIL